MSDALDVFVAAVPDGLDRKPAELIDYFTYFLTEVEGQQSATAAEINQCFAESHIAAYSNVSTYLNRQSAKKRGKKPKYIRVGRGFRLERSAHEALGRTLTVGPGKAKGAELLGKLVQDIADPDEKAFLAEAVSCYRIDARRAVVVLVWNLTMFHLQRYVMAHHRAAFDAVLAKNKDRRVKITSINTQDDFSDIPEGKFIEFLRSARVISNDVRKILNVKLGVRNTYAHPSSVAISEVKAADFVIDLVENVVQKYAL